MIEDRGSSRKGKEREEISKLRDMREEGAAKVQMNNPYSEQFTVKEID